MSNWVSLVLMILSIQVTAVTNKLGTFSISYPDFIKLKAKAQFKAEFSKSAMLRFTMNELVTFHIRRCAEPRIKSM
jgi:hypothetical protein